jgi:hypothetical protein
MPKYFILYGGSISRDAVFKTDYECNSESEAREWFEKFFPLGTLVFIRKGRPFTKADIQRARQKLR